jgi:hypothetical protein
VERDDFVVEGVLGVGPTEKFFVFLDGEYFGKLLVDHFRLPEEKGYTDLGRVRVTVERLEEPRPQP